VHIADGWLSELKPAVVGGVCPKSLLYSAASLAIILAVMPTAVLRAGLANSAVVRHTFRHTSVTWLMQAAQDNWKVAGFARMSLGTLERTYGHHRPDHQTKLVMPSRRKGGTVQERRVIDGPIDWPNKICDSLSR
jgi:hypothetical protein